jgi:hypothetical protein
MPGFQDRATRRSLLAALVAAAGTGAVVAARPARAADGDPVLAGQDTTATKPTRVVLGEHNANAFSQAALIGESNQAAAGGVYGFCGVSDPGVLGQGVRFGVLGRGIENDGEVGVGGESVAGIGVQGRSETGTGVHGFSQTNTGMFGYGGKMGVFGFSFPGLGGQFGGGRAALQLIPRPVAGAPTTGAHERGELVIDSAGALFVCTAPGTPGTWKRVLVS